MSPRPATPGGLNCVWRFDRTPEPWVATLFLDIQRSPLFRNLNNIYRSGLVRPKMYLCFSDDVCVLSVTGTAAIINLLFTSGEIGVLNTALSATAKVSSGGAESNNDNSDATLKKSSPPKSQLANNGGKSAALKHSKSTENSVSTEKNTAENSIDCSICHIPYSRTSVPFNEHMKKCLVCKYDIYFQLSVTISSN